MTEYHEDALEIIRDNFLYYLNKEYKNFIVNSKLYDYSRIFLSVVDGQNEKLFVDFGHEDENVTLSEIIERLTDNDKEDSLYKILSENTFKNIVSVFEDYLKEILQFLFINYPYHAFKDGKIDQKILIEYDSLDSLKEELIKEKIVSMTYKNLAEIIRYIEKEFKIDFDLDNEIIDGVYELTQIRNLLVHNKGIINRRFMERLKGKEQLFGETPYELDYEIIMTASEMGFIYKLFLKVGNSMFQFLNPKYGNKKETAKNTQSETNN